MGDEARATALLRHDAEVRASDAKHAEIRRVSVISEDLQ